MSKCNIYQHSVTVNNFSDAFKNVLCQNKNAKNVFSLPYLIPVFLGFFFCLFVFWFFFFLCCYLVFFLPTVCLRQYWDID